MRTYPFSSSEKLLLRLCDSLDSQRPLSYLVGSGICGPGASPEERGVPSVPAMVGRARSALTRDRERRLFDAEMEATAPPQRYQQAFKFLLECKGREEVGRLVRGAVTEARLRPVPGDPTETECERLEHDIHGWAMRPGLAALGRLLVSYPQSQRGPILTTNFDPLLEVSIRRAGGQSEPFPLAFDGRYDYVAAQQSRYVVHLHGYWRGRDTLHTPEQIVRDRPQLQGCLARHLRGSTLVVLGYGGWDDVATRTLLREVAEGIEDISVLWAFYSSDEDEIVRDHESVLRALAPGIGQNVILYKGVDAHFLLPSVLVELGVGQPPPPVTVVAKPAPEHTRRSSGAATVVSVTVTKRAERLCDVPPEVDVWVGRRAELNALRSTTQRVVAVTGFGGHGKSVLVSRFLQDIGNENSDWEAWDWRDCKEQNNKIQTHLMGMVSRLTNGSISSNELKGEDVSAVVEALFGAIGDRKWVFVLDNVDFYVDVDAGQATLGLKALVDAALRLPHRCKFILTCRAKLQYESPQFAHINLGHGLSPDEAMELFRLRGVNVETIETQELIKDAYSLTLGHPLCLNLVAGRAALGPDPAKEVLDEIRKGGAIEMIARTLRVVWSGLNDKQRLLLRMMAVTVRPESEESLAAYCERRGLNHNQYRKAIRVLRDCHMVVVLSTPGMPQLLDLHPLVREFVRQESPPEERSKAIDAVVFVYDKLLSLWRKAPETGGRSLQQLEVWTQKAELQVDRQDYEGALQTLYEVKGWVASTGHLEEFVRVGWRLFREVDLSTLVSRDPRYLHEVIQGIAVALADLGRPDDVDLLLRRYEDAIAGRGATYINYCYMRSYSNWVRGDYTNAIAWGQRGADLKAESGIDTNFDCADQLALAQRDGGEVDVALNYFLSSRELAQVLAPGDLSLGNGPFYGNIGRCLFKLNRHKQALLCYRKSIHLLKRDNDNKNLGFADHWIGQALLACGQKTMAYYFLRHAAHRWRRIAPVRARAVDSEIDALLYSEPMLEDLAGATDIEVENKCAAWLAAAE